MICERAPQECRPRAARERAKREDATARKQRRHHLEGRILRGGTDQRHGAALDVRQQGVLLGAVEAVDLVEEEHGPATGSRFACGALDHVAHVAYACRHGGERDERCTRRIAREQARERRLAAARRTPEDQRGQVACLRESTQGSLRADEFALSHDFVENARPHPVGERRMRRARRSGTARLGLAARRGRSRARFAAEEGQRVVARHGRILIDALLPGRPPEALNGDPLRRRCDQGG